MAKTIKDIHEMKEKMNEGFLRMTPDALDALHDMMMDPNINPMARVQAISLILERGLGKPEESIRIQDNQADREAARKRLEAIAERIRIEIDK